MAKEKNDEVLSVELTTDEIEDVAGGVLVDGDNFYTQGIDRSTNYCSCHGP
jgi:hypothetical protein